MWHLNLILYQNVVASIACDPNVWSAVLKNEALVEYLQSQKTSMNESITLCFSYTSYVYTVDLLVIYTGTLASQSVNECESQTPNCFHDELYDSEKDIPQNGFLDFFENIKVRVEEMLTSFSSYFQRFFGASDEVDGSNKPTFGEIAMGSFMGLAVMVVMLVVLKRH